ncbi:MAG: DUF3122 domain-containing protein [Cyanobacteria bacterium P01_E01_bin.42]
MSLLLSWRGLILSLLLIPSILSWVAIAPPVTAAIYPMQETLGQMLYQSRHTLRDEFGEPWQVILFKREKINGENSVHLRLVGFPDVAFFNREQPLKIFVSTGELLAAKDIFNATSSADNVAEFDFQKILPQLPTLTSVQFLLNMQNNGAIALQIPAEVVLEWHLLIER